MKNPNLVIFSAALVIAILSISCYGTARTVRALQFEPNIMPVLQMGVPYETKIRITQNVTPAGDIWISKGTLPAGLELVRMEGEDAVKISGISQEVGTFTFTVSVWCYGTSVNGQTGVKEYSIVVEN